MTLRIAVLASGRGSNMVSLLDKIKAGHVEARVTLVVSDRPAASCLEKARDHGVPACLELPPEPGETRDGYGGRLLDVLRDEDPDLIVLAGFMRILSSALVDAFAGRIVNIHPALLPSFKGARGIRDTLAAGAALAGCTTHIVTSELDGGPMVLQAALAVHQDDNEESLAARVLEMEHLLLPRTVQLFAEGRIERRDNGVAVAPGPSWTDTLPPPPGSVFSEGY